MRFRSLILILAICLSPSPLLAQDVPPFANPGTVPFTQSVLVSGLQGPWEITWGPDSMLWVTERTAGRIDRINPKSGQVNPAITFTDMVTKSGQDGLLGMALDPGLGKGTGHDFVYTAYTHLDPARRADPAMKDPASPHLHMYAKISGSGMMRDRVFCRTR